MNIRKKKFPQSTFGFSLPIGSKRVVAVIFLTCSYSSLFFVASQAHFKYHKDEKTRIPLCLQQRLSLSINIHGTILVISLKKLQHTSRCSRKRCREPELPDGLFSRSYLFSIPSQKMQIECNTIGQCNNYSKSLCRLEEITSLL